MMQVRLATLALLGLTIAAGIAQAPSIDPAVAALAPLGPARIELSVASQYSQTRDGLRTAHDALVSGRAAEAHEALERARMCLPNHEGPLVSRINEAILALGYGKRAHAIQAVNSALTS